MTNEELRVIQSIRLILVNLTWGNNDPRIQTELDKIHSFLEAENRNYQVVRGVMES